MSNLPVIERRPWREPRDVFAEYATRRHCVWLDSAGGDSRYSILAAEPSHVISTRSDPFAALEKELDARRVTSDAAFPTGAAIGYFGYGLKNCIERLPARATDDLGLPDCWVGFYDNLLVFDHTEQAVFEVGRDRPVVWSSTAIAPDRGELRSNFTRDTYRAAILRAKEYIAAGDVYQVNLSQRFQCGIEVAPAELYLTLRETNPAPYCAYLDIGDAQILSSSPECFLSIHDRHVVTRPIKGTRPRDCDPKELLRSPKDNAELLMIVDLERNDLGKVCQYGSVRVSELVRVESYATVHHLVATVEGLLRRDVSHVDCVRACFPGGSITGAPKIRAMEIVDELEPHARGVYCGAIGFLGYNGVSHLNIAIRTAVHQQGRLTFHAGGGIVADSDPDAEYDETLTKAQGIIRAIERCRR